LLDQLAAGEATLELPATPGDEPAATATDANLDEEDLYDNMYGFH
jgi:hypothetical protein